MEIIGIGAVVKLGRLKKKDIVEEFLIVSPTPLVKSQVKNMTTFFKNQERKKLKTKLKDKQRKYQERFRAL